MSPTIPPLDPDRSCLPAGRDLTFAVLRGMAEPGPDRTREQLTAIERPVLEWAYYFMCQSYYAAISASVGHDQELTRERILTFVQGCETYEDMRAVVDEVDLSPMPPLKRGDQP